MTLPTCSRCGQEKQLDQFYFDGAMGNRRRSECKTCTKEGLQKQEVKESRKEYMRRYRAKNPGRSKGGQVGRPRKS